MLVLPGGERLLVSTLEGKPPTSIKLWLVDAATGATVHEFKPIDRGGHAVISADGRRLAAMSSGKFLGAGKGYDQKTVHIFELTGDMRTRTVAPPDSMVNALALHPRRHAPGGASRRRRDRPRLPLGREGRGDRHL